MQNFEHSEGSEKDTARRRLMQWFTANMTAWLYEIAKKHISKHSRVYSAYQLDIGGGTFKRAFITHPNAVTTAVKRTSRTSECDGRVKEMMLKGDLEINDDQRRKQRSNEKEDVKTQNCLVCDKNSN